MVEYPGAYQDIMSRAIDDFFTSFDFLPLTVFEDTGGSVFKTHISHGPEKIMVTANLPGMNASDIDVIIKSDALIIAGEKKGTGDGSLPASGPDEQSSMSLR
ncbi:MAG TPA: hypothetical protein PLA83_10630, partial [Deltaproteobacteria bacterium]|nr:hypothetical protein [Deltaproteobacteria bacterium]